MRAVRAWCPVVALEFSEVTERPRLPHDAATAVTETILQHLLAQARGREGNVVCYRRTMDGWGRGLGTCQALTYQPVTAPAFHTAFMPASSLLLHAAQIPRN